MSKLRRTIEDKTGLTLDKFGEVMEAANRKVAWNWKFMANMIEGVRDDFDFSDWTGEEIFSLIEDIYDNSI